MLLDATSACTITRFIAVCKVARGSTEQSGACTARDRGLWAYLKSFLMLLMVEVEALVPPENTRHLWREHIVLHEPISHVVVLSAPAPKVHAIPIDPLKLLSGENTDASKEVLSWHTVSFQQQLAGATRQ